jgi:hypothetical protein
VAEPNTLLTLILSGIGLALFLLGPDALLVGLIFSSIFQAMAFLNFGESPLLAYYFFGALYLLRSGVDILWQPSLLQWSKGKNAPFFWLLAFVALATFGAVFLPIVFKGAMIYSPKLSIDEQYNNLTPLELSSAHFNQAGQLIINVLIFAVIWLRRVSPVVLLRAIMLSFGVVIIFAVWQLLANLSGTYFPDEWLYTVNGWSIGNQQTVGSSLRINSVFLEPSTLSTYLVGIFAFLMIWWVKLPSWLRLGAVFLSLMSMVITLSTTSYIGLLLVTATVFFGFGIKQLVNGGWMKRPLFGILTLTLLLAWLILIVLTASDQARELFDWVLTDKAEGDSFRFRLEADIQSFEILWRTYGFGLGLGSNRPSSFLALLASNLGVLGLLSFVMFTVSLSRSALQNTKKFSNEIDSNNLQACAVSAVWGLWALIFAKVFSQPDLSFAPLWVWIFFLTSFCNWHQDQSKLLPENLS